METGELLIHLQKIELQLNDIVIDAINAKEIDNIIAILNDLLKTLHYVKNNLDATDLIGYLRITIKGMQLSKSESAQWMKNHFIVVKGGINDSLPFVIGYLKMQIN